MLEEQWLTHGRKLKRMRRSNVGFKAF